MAGKEQPSSLHSTKQLLDELDALMEKMLSLPVSTQEGPLPAEDSLSRLPQVSATLTVLERAPAVEQPRPTAPQHEEPAASPRLDRATEIAAPHADFTSRPTGRGYQEESLASPARTPGVRVDSALEAELPLDAVPPSLLQVEVPTVEVLPRQPRRWHSLVIWPFLWINGIFDLATFFLGPLGRWLRTPQGRNALAAAGILLMLLAAGWVVRDWMSWTQ